MISTHLWKTSYFGLFIFYIYFVTVTISSQGFFGYIGSDYRAYRAAAIISRSDGFSEVYDLAKHDSIQRPLYDVYAEEGSQISYVTLPTPYFPLFISSFAILSILDPIPNFVLYTAFNVILLGSYLVRFLKAVDYKRGYWFVAPLALSLPSFFNIQFGSMNVWLLIFMGEAIIALSRENNFNAGMWLGGLLLKPQTLILLVPGMLIGKRFRMLAGLTITGLLVLLFSTLIAGFDGIRNMAELILLYPRDFPEVMMNWRGLAVNLDRSLPTQLSWGIAIIGMVLTAGLAFSLWRVPLSSSSKQFQIVLLGTYGATGVVTWHSHVYLALPIVVLLISTYGNHMLHARVLHLWVLAPAAIFALVIISGTFGDAHIWAGMATMLLNVFLILWAAMTLRKPQI
ncbi:MAG: DUF2029 domain-containing protein [Chloroflexi bacterium]|nr:DUF2029 domain-containing protein [Chloroflexota bacterium]